MSITDELRKVAAKTECANGRCEKLYRGDLEHIADRIDAEHESACGEAYGNGVQSVALPDMTAYVELPKDADGEVWHIGDRTESGQTIEAMGLNKHGWHFVGTVNEIDPAIHRHYHAPTVEDVLREFALAVCKDDALTIRRDVVDEYAAKLRLAGSDVE